MANFPTITHARAHTICDSRLF